MNREVEALSLLKMYAKRLPENPNTQRYLAEWYLNKAGYSFNDWSEIRLALPQLTRQFCNSKVQKTEKEKVKDAADKRRSTQHLTDANPLLFHLAQYSLALLPEAKPECEENEIEDNSLHLIVIEACIMQGMCESITFSVTLEKSRMIELKMKEEEKRERRKSTLMK